MSHIDVERAMVFHDLASNLPRFDGRFVAGDLPANGVYLMFEAGETIERDGGSVERIVRVGTHRADGGLVRRLRRHYAGRRGNSVLRRHLGGALLARADPDDARLTDWHTQRAVPFPDVEVAVSEALRDRFTFCCLRVDGASERLDLERGLIALLGRGQIGAPSDGWLGHHAISPAIRSSGLWNTLHTGGVPIDGEGIDRLVRLVRVRDEKRRGVVMG